MQAIDAIILTARHGDAPGKSQPFWRQRSAVARLNYFWDIHLPGEESGQERVTPRRLDIQLCSKP